MTEELNNQSLESLSQAWSEKIRDIRRIAKDGKPDSGGASIESPVNDTTVISEKDVFVEEQSDTFAVQDIFAGDEAFYQSLTNMQSEAAVLPSEPAVQHSYKQARPVPKILIYGFLLMSLGMLFWGIWFFIISYRLTGLSPQPAMGRNQASLLVPDEQQEKEQPKSESLPIQETPISLKTAQDYYQKGQYRLALTVYERLLEDVSETVEQAPLRDFLRLNAALCLQKINEPQASADLVKAVLQSPSPAVRILANYQLCLYELNNKHFMTARSRAYKAIGLLDAMASENDWPRDIQRNCSFLAIEAVTREVLTLADADTELPSGLWPQFDEQVILLANLDQDTLNRVLNAGRQQLNKALLGPIVEEVIRDDAAYWTVVCDGASIGELISRFSTNAGYDVHWKIDSEKGGFRNRSVSLCLNAVHARQLITAAAGSAGLLSYLDENEVLTICNPEEFGYLSDQVALLSAEAVWAWQRYLLTFQQESYCDYAHFALGLLKVRQGLTAEALAEYKTITGHYSDSLLGPYALTCSANLKTGLHDYQGAYQDLKEIVEQYPDYERIGQTYLAMAAAADKIGNREEAARIYCKVYYLNKSPELQSAGSLAAGQVFYEEHNYAEAERWLSRYINLAEDNTDQEFYQACLLLGKTWLSMGKSELAYDALGTALSGRLSRQDYLETVSTLVNGYMQQDHYIRALQVLHDATAQQLSQAESTQMLILESKALRGMGLTDKAVSLLTNQERYIIDDRLASQVGYAISECYIEQGRLELAYKKLVSILETVGTGPIAHQTSLKLMDVCIQLGRDEQAIHVANELLKTQPPDEIRQDASVLLAGIYQDRKNYEQAALTLIGQPQ